MSDAFKYFERMAELVADDGLPAQAAVSARRGEGGGELPSARPVERPRRAGGWAWARLFAALLRPHGGTA
jgi:hypothetical protein